MIDWVDADLTEWGAFFKDDASPLGYPKQTIESRMKDGCFGGKDKGKRAADPYVPEAVARTESIVRQLPEHQREVLIVAYTVMVSREKQSRILSERLGVNRITRTKLMSEIDAAHGWFAGLSQSIK